MVTTQGTHTFADLVELPDDSPIYDVLGGEFVVRNIPDVNHALARIELTGLLYAAQEAGYGYVFSDTTAVALEYLQSTDRPAIASGRVRRRRRLGP